MTVTGADRSERPAALRSYNPRAARFTIQRAEGDVGVIAVGGELDASNAGQLASYVAQCPTGGLRLILDLSGLEFVGTEAFSVLNTINTRCARSRTQWALVAGDAVSRLLRVCDPQTTLPITHSVPAAIALLDGEANRLGQLVAQLR